MEEPTIAGYNPVDTTLMANTIAPTTYTPTTPIAQDIQKKLTQPDLSKDMFAKKSMFGDTLSPDTKTLGGYENTAYKQQYDLLNSGEFTPRYENFIPNTNNEERLVQKQTTGEVVAHGFERFGLKTLTAIAGGTLGVVDSLVEGVAKGSLSEAYNTDFNKWLDDLNTQVDYKLPIYYTEQEKNASLFGQLGVKFLADKALGGLSFTIGAIVSEGIWAAATGGVGAVLAEGAQLSRWTAEGLGGESALMRTLNKAKSMAKGSWKTELESAPRLAGAIAEESKAAAISGYKVGKLANMAMVTLRSAGFESGMEARQYMKSTEAAWKDNFEKTMGRTPTAEEYNEFKDGLTTSANWVFGANMAIVGGSNAIQFRNTLFGKSVTNSVETNWIERNILGVGFKKTETGALEAIAATKGQKVLGKIYGVAKNMVVEGQEEMSQSIASGTAENYILAAYDPKHTKDTYSVADALAQSIQKTYGTKEGLTEGLVGAIVGIFGGAIETRGKFNQVSEKRAQIAEQATYYNAFTSKMHINNVIANNRMLYTQELKADAQAKGDFTGELLADKASALQVIERLHAIDNLKQGTEDFALQMRALDNKELMQELNLDSEKDAQDFKERKIAEFSSLAKTHEKNLKYAQALLGEVDIAGLPLAEGITKQQVERGIAYNITMEQGALEINNDLISHAKGLIADIISTPGATDAMDVESILDLAPKEKQKELKTLSSQLQSANRRLQALQDKEVQASKIYKEEDNTKRVNKLTDIQQEIEQTQKDIDRISQERQVAFDALGVKHFTDAEVTLDMLDAQSENVKKLKDTLQNLKIVDPQKYANVLKILEEQSKAVHHIKQYDKVTQMITDPSTRVKLINGWMSKMLNKHKKLNEGTEAYFRDVVNSWREGTIEATQTATKREEDRKFKAGEEVTPEYIAALKKAQEEGQYLDETDLQILESEEATISPPTEAQKVEKQIADLLKEKQEMLKEGTSIVNNNSEIKRIEKERQKALKPYDERNEKSLEAINPNNPNHKIFKVGTKVVFGMNIRVEQTNTDNWNGEGDGYTVITAVKELAEFDNKGKMTKPPKVQTAIFNSKEDADAAIQATFEKAKSKAGQKQKEINAKYDTELEALKQNNIQETFKKVFSSFKGRRELLKSDPKLAYIYNNIKSITEEKCD